jgi:hypothetical protein
VDGEGTEEIRAIADRFRAILAFSEDQSCYCDWCSNQTLWLEGHRRVLSRVL